MSRDSIEAFALSPMDGLRAIVLRRENRQSVIGVSTLDLDSPYRILNEESPLIGRVDVAFALDGMWLCAQDEVGEVRLWRTSDWSWVSQCVEAPANSRGAVEFFPDSARLACKLGDFDVCLRRVPDLAFERRLTGHSAAVTSLRIRADGAELASNSRDETTRLWDLTDERAPVVLRGHTETVFACAYSPDGTRIATGSGDRTVRLWNPATGEQQIVLRRHPFRVQDLLFDATGETLISVGDAMRLWSTVPLAERVRAR